MHCVKNVPNAEFFSGRYFPVFGFNTEFTELNSKAPYSVRVQENMDQKKSPYLEHFTQW